VDVERYIEFYTRSIRRMWRVRAGGRLRSLKGTLVEDLADMMIRDAWAATGGDAEGLSIDKKKQQILDDRGHVYGLSQDKHVHVDGVFVLSVECKAYAEVAMFKRILVDASLLHTRYPGLRFCLFQLESMLGDDYATRLDPPGSDSVHVLTSHFREIDIEILTLLDGERDITRPIHRKQFFKAMNPERAVHAFEYFERTLRNARSE